MKEKVDVEKVNLLSRKNYPRDYHWKEGKYSVPLLGEIKKKDGSYYSRLERREYCCKEEKDHIAKTPLHIARWAIQNYTKINDWVLDPTLGAGTTAVEAIRLNRNCMGIEIEKSYIPIINRNVELNNIYGKSVIVECGDARDLKMYLNNRIKKIGKFSLIVNNPPYSGDLDRKRVV